MFNELNRHFSWRGACLMAGRYEDLANHYVLPFRADLAGRKVSLSAKDDLILQLHRTRLALLQRGTVALRPLISAIELPASGQRVWLQWQELRSDGKIGERADVVYDTRNEDGWIKVVEATYTSLIVDIFGRRGALLGQQRSR